MLSAVSVALYLPVVAWKIHQVEELQQIHEAAVEGENYLLGLTLPAWLSTKLLLEDNMQQKRTVLLARISPSVPTVIDIDDEGEGGEREEAQEEPNLRVGPVHLWNLLSRSSQETSVFSADTGTVVSASNAAPPPTTSSPSPTTPPTPASPGSTVPRGSDIPSPATVSKLGSGQG